MESVRQLRAVGQVGPTPIGWMSQLLLLQSAALYIQEHFINLCLVNCCVLDRGVWTISVNCISQGPRRDRGVIDWLCLFSLTWKPQHPQTDVYNVHVGIVQWASNMRSLRKLFPFGCPYTILCWRLRHQAGCDSSVPLSSFYT